jgi:hypothetical protein
LVVYVFPMHLMLNNHEVIHSYVLSLVCLFVMYDLPKMNNRFNKFQETRFIVIGNFNGSLRNLFQSEVLAVLYLGFFLPRERKTSSGGQINNLEHSNCKFREGEVNLRRGRALPLDKTLSLGTLRAHRVQELSNPMDSEYPRHISA